MSQPLLKKHTLLKAIKSTFHTPDQLTQLLSSTFLTPLIRRYLHKKALTALITLDIKISVCHDYMVESEWEHITNPYQTPTDEHKDIRTSITDLKRLFEICRGTEQNVFLDFFERNILMLKTKHVQFLLFEYNPKTVLSFLFGCFMKRKGKENYFLVYIFSYVVRREMEIVLVTKVIEELVMLYKKENNKKSKLLFLQGFVYLCCFKQEMYQRLEEIIREGDLRNINRKILSVFCSIFNCEVESLHKDEPLLEWFPLDPTPVEEILSLYEDKYLLFNKSF